MSDLVAASLFAISQYEANKKDRPDFDPMEYIIEYEKGKLITVQELLDFFMENKDKVCNTIGENTSTQNQTTGKKSRKSTKKTTTTQK